MSSSRIPVVDLFAGPGGLSEGFAAFPLQDDPRYRIALSIEKDPAAHHTLRLRAFLRQFPHGKAPREYYEHLQLKLSLDELYRTYPQQAARAADEAWLAELGAVNQRDLHDRVARARGGSDNWVLIGGPPCQAYSLVGRSRNAHNPLFARDQRHLLYREYLKIIAGHWPRVFVMENVKGLLSATHEARSTFQMILNDLREPGKTLGQRNKYTYRVVPLNPPEGLFRDAGDTVAHEPRDYVVRAERHGIPQRRHRVILIGIRSDVRGLPDRLTENDTGIGVSQVLDSLPRLRSGLSERDDSRAAWHAVLHQVIERPWFAQLGRNGAKDIQDIVRNTLDNLSSPRQDRGAEFIGGAFPCTWSRKWFADRRLGGICNHSSRSHMAEDLHRYLFVASFAKAQGHTPSLRDLPAALLPRHANVRTANRVFADRFRVQLRDIPATTVTSHIAKDGHYYIHYDPSQCRSLTVREAARLQTFPDNYLFCGPRTVQYQQVGNAVPPLLAYQIAASIHHLLA